MAKSRFRIVPPRIFPYVDWLLILFFILLAGCGLVTLWGATTRGDNLGLPGYFVQRQGLFLVVGIILATVLAIIDYRRWQPLVWWGYGVYLVLLIGLLIKDATIKGAASWYDLGFFKLQPSEPGKILVILALAGYLAPRIDRIRGLFSLLVPGIIAGVPILLIVKQNDFGTAFVYIPTVAAMLWVAGLRKWIFILFLALGVCGIFAGYPHLKPHQKDRIQTFLNPDRDPRGKGYNVLQSQMTLGSGEFFGRGWGQGTQTKLRFLPEYQTDFIFPTVGEQFGFVGCSVALSLMLLLIWRLVRLAQMTPNIYGVLVITGFAAMLCTHMLLNIGMAIGLLPVTGLPLPFFSYGGSFLVTCCAGLGLALGIGARREVEA